FDFNASDSIIFTRMRNLPAARLQGCQLEGSLVSDGCLVQPGSQLERCLVGQRMQIGENVTIRESVLCGADRFESRVEREINREQGIPDLGIGAGSVIVRAVVDKDCRIGKNVRIVNDREIRETEKENYVIRDGIVVIPKHAVLPDGTVI